MQFYCFTHRFHNFRKHRQFFLTYTTRRCSGIFLWRGTTPEVAMVVLRGATTTGRAPQHLNLFTCCLATVSAAADDAIWSTANYRCSTGIQRINRWVLMLHILNVIISYLCIFRLSCLAVSFVFSSVGITCLKYRHQSRWCVGLFVYCQLSQTHAILSRIKRKKGKKCICIAPLL